MRTVSDDNLPACLETLGYEQSFTLSDIKLALGVATVAIAGFMFYLDKKFGFYETYWVLVACITAYFAISGVLFYLNMGSAKNNKYVGYNGKHKVLVHTWTLKFEPVYHVKLYVDGEQRGGELDLPFTKFFDSFGYFNREALTELLAKSLAKKTE